MRPPKTGQNRPKTPINAYWHTAFALFIRLAWQLLVTLPLTATTKRNEMKKEGEGKMKAREYQLTWKQAIVSGLMDENAKLTYKALVLRDRRNVTFCLIDQ